MSTEDRIVAAPSTEVEVILDRRYRILRKIGEGGFGVVYEAENLHTGKRVAIKEQKTGDIRRFLREARILRDYADEPNIVTVLDSFEENEKAYLVMEYIDGKTLAKAVRQNGKWPAEKAVRAFVPVMHALERMHKSGVIHRDISPDNLIMRPNGSLVLMDFGAAKQENDTSVTQGAVYKSIYSPPEQREADAITRSTTDVYALAATLYFAITGTEPEDVLSRLLFDELKKPSEAGSDILPSAEAAILSGMELRPENRTQTVQEIREALEAVYPDLTEEEKNAIAEKRKRRKRIIFGVIAAVVLIAAAIVWVYRIPIRLSMIDTVVLELDGSEMTQDDFRECDANAARRFHALADGKPYLWKEDPQTQRISVTCDKTIFQEKNPQFWMRYTVTRPMRLYLSTRNENGDETKFGLFSQTEDIESAGPVGEDFFVTFTNAGRKRLGDVLSAEGIEVRFNFDSEEYKNGYGYLGGYTVGDGKRIRVPDPSEIGFLLPHALQTDLLTRTPSPKAFSVQTEWEIRWEDPDTTLFPGKNQRKEINIPGKTISLEYSTYADPAEEVAYDPDVLSFQGILKNRLDSLGIPYAVGIPVYASDRYVVKVPIESVHTEELALLGESLYSEMDLGSRYTLISRYEEAVVDESEDGRFRFGITLYLNGDKEKREKYTDMLQSIERQEDPNVYLYFEGIRIARCPAAKAIKDLAADGIVWFTEWENTIHPAMDAGTVGFARFIAIANSKKPPNTYTGTGSTEFRDEEGKIIFFPTSELIPECRFQDKEWEDHVGALEESGAAGATVETYRANRSLNIIAYEIRIDQPEEALAPYLSFLTENMLYFKDGTFQNVKIYLYSGTEEDLDNTCVSLTWKTDIMTGDLNFNDVSFYPAKSDEMEARLKKAYTEAAISFP